MRICKICGAEFEPKQKRSIYCSRECQIRAYSLNRSLPEAKKCEWCGKEFTPKHKNKKYCCSKCSREAYLELQRQYAEKRNAEKPIIIPKPTPIESDKEPIICLHCGKEFIPRSGNQIFCARECSTLYHRRLNNPPKERTCARCGKLFTVTGTNKQYCSDECRKKKEYKYSKKIVEDDKEKPKKKISPASKRWAKMSWERLTEELLYYGIKYRDAQVMAENNTLPKDFGIKRKRCK